MRLLFLLLSAGVASQIHYRDIPLSEVVAASPTIVVVEPADPPQRTITVTSGSVSLETVLERLRVVSVVRAPEGQVSPAQVIEVGAPHISEHLMIVRRYEEEGMSISPIYKRYAGEPPGEGPQIVFLRPCFLGETERLCLSVEGAAVPAAMLPDVQALLAAEAGGGG